MNKRVCLGTILLWFCSLATAAATPVEPFDEQLAIEINVTCAGCHGEYGQGVADGTYPRLAGLDATYLARQMRLFKTRERLNIPMFPYATERELPEEDVLVISQYLSTIKLITKMPPINEATYDPLERLKLARQVFNIPRFAGDVQKGKRFYDKECATCHGRDGLGKRKKKAQKEGEELIYPRLAGQHSKYLLRQIKDIGDGSRFHDEKDDAAIFKSIPEKEIRDVLAFLSTLDAK